MILLKRSSWQHFLRWSFAESSPNNPWAEAVRTTIRIAVIMYREFFQTHISIRASALTCSILLSLVPTLALTTSILKGLGNDEQLKTIAIRFIEQIEPPVPAVDGKQQEHQLTPSLPQQTLASSPQFPSHLHRAVNYVFAYVNRTNFAALGIFGVVGLISAVILVLSSLEDAMNAIWHTKRGRPLFRKLMDYLALLILLPLSLNIALAAQTIFSSNHIMIALGKIMPIGLTATFFLKLIPFFSIVVTLMVMYLFFPHTKVKTSAALLGALFAAIFWFTVQKAYIVLQIGAASYNAIYGSFATIPLVIVWLHIGCTFILLGASLSHAIQTHQHYTLFPTAQPPRQKLQLAFDILYQVYADFNARHDSSLESLNEHFPGISSGELYNITELLINGNLLHRQEQQDNEFFLPVTPPEKLSAAEVLEVIFGKESTHSTGSQLAQKAIESAREAMISVHFASDQEWKGQQHVPGSDSRGENRT